MAGGVEARWPDSSPNYRMGDPMSVLNPLALPDGYYSKWAIHNPSPGMERAFEYYAQYMPRHDDRYCGVVLRGGQVAKVVMSVDLDENGHYAPASPVAVEGGGVVAVASARVVTNFCANCKALADELAEAKAELANLEAGAVEDPRTLAQLRRLCKEHGLRADGDKAALAGRLTNAGVA